jgi:hypothetical protein
VTLGGLNRWFIPRGQDLAFLLSCIGLLGLRAAFYLCKTKQNKTKYTTVSDGGVSPTTELGRPYGLALCFTRQEHTPVLIRKEGGGGRRSFDGQTSKSRRGGGMARILSFWKHGSFLRDR